MTRLDRWSEARASSEVALALAADLPADDPHVLGARADALVSLAVCDERAGDPQRARQRWAEAQPLARRAANLGVELRTHYNIGMSLLDEGRLAEASAAFGAGEARAAETGITWSGYGLDLRVAHVMTQFMRGHWDEAETAAEIAGASVSATVATRLAAASLLVAVGRGRLEFAARRATELRDSHPADEQVVMLLGQAGAEAALWQGDGSTAARRVDDALTRLDELFPHQLGGIMLSALGIAAHAQAAVPDPPGAARAEEPAVALAAARALAARAEETAEKGAPRAGVLGPEGRAWLLMARAELTRLTGPDPEAWSAVIIAFGFETRWDRGRLPAGLRAPAACRGAAGGRRAARGGGRRPARGKGGRGGAQGGAVGHGRRGDGAYGPGSGSTTRSRTSPPRCAHPARAVGVGVGRRRAHQPSGRRGALHQREDGQRAPVTGDGQARREQPHRGRHDRVRQRAARSTRPARHPVLGFGHGPSRPTSPNLSVPA